MARRLARAQLKHNRRPHLRQRATRPPELDAMHRRDAHLRRRSIQRRRHDGPRHVRRSSEQALRCLRHGGRCFLPRRFTDRAVVPGGMPTRSEREEVALYQPPWA